MNATNPSLVAPNSEPAKQCHSQTKKNTKIDKEGSYQTSNQVTGPNADLSPKRQGMQKADMDMPAGNNGNGMDDKSAPTILAQPCKHGCKAAAPAEEAKSGPPVSNNNNDMNNGHTPMIPAQPCKRGRKAAAADDNTPPAKQTKEDEASVDQLPHQQGKAGPARKKAVAVLRDPLPDCPGRDVHPAQQPAKRHTPQEVAAEWSVQRKAIEDAIQAGERAKQLLAQMNVAEDCQDDGMDAENPQRISAANRKRTYDELEENSDGESFDFGGVESVLNSLDEEPVPKGKGVSENDSVR